jgi:hypothetical protein
MIPLDQEYGKRQETKQLMPLAGLPTGSRAAPTAAPAGRAAAAGAPADFLTARNPTRPMNWTAPDPLDRLRNLAATSPNLYVRALLKRLLEEQSGP